MDQSNGNIGSNAAGLDLLLRSVVDYAIYMLDADGVVQSWNTGGEQIRGYSASEIVGQLSRGSTHPRTWPADCRSWD